MPTPIDEKTLKRLEELARIEIKSDAENKLLKDLQKILEHFEELKTVDTENVEPMAGGTVETNVFREDKPSDKRQTASDRLIEQFPEKENGFLKVPAVFENNNE